MTTLRGVLLLPLLLAASGCSVTRVVSGSGPGAETVTMSAEEAKLVDRMENEEPSASGEVCRYWTDLVPRIREDTARWYANRKASLACAERHEAPAPSARPAATASSAEDERTRRRLEDQLRLAAEAEQQARAQPDASAAPAASRLPAASQKLEAASGLRISELHATLEDTAQAAIDKIACRAKAEIDPESANKCVIPAEHMGIVLRVRFDLTIVRAQTHEAAVSVRAACQVDDKRMVGIDLAAVHLDELRSGDTTTVEVRPYGLSGKLSKAPSHCEIAVLKGSLLGPPGTPVRTWCLVPGKEQRDGPCTWPAR